MFLESVSFFGFTYPFLLQIIHAQCEDQADLTEFRILDLDGKIQHEQFIDGKIQSLAVASNGDVFLTKQPPKGADEFFIYK